MPTIAAPAPLVLDDDSSALPFDLLDVLPSVTVSTRQLRPGMVLLDPDFGTAAAILDHRIATTDGVASWLIQDLDTGGWVTTRISVRTPVTVAAR